MSKNWNVEAVLRGLGDVAKDTPRIQRRFCELLNTYHRRTEGFEYWDLIGGEWLLHFSHVVYAAYREVTEAPAAGTDGLVLPVFGDFREFIHASAAGDAAFWNALRIHVEAILGAPANRPWRFAHRTSTVGCETANLRTRIKGVATRLATVGWARQAAPFVFCHPTGVGGRGEWIGTLRKWRSWARQDDFQYRVTTTAAVDANWRRERAAEITVAGYADVMCALMPLYLPVIYLEGFTAFRNQACALGLVRPRAVFTTYGLLGHTLFKVLAADWRAEGTRLLAHQHGGGYGIDRIHAIEEYETRVADRFYTLGWSDTPKQVPLAGASLRQVSRRGVPRSRVLLTCVNFPDTVFRLHFHPMPGTVDAMVAQTVEFVAHVRDGVELTVRPYPYDYGRNFVARLRQTGTAFALDDRRIGGTESYARSSLVVHNYLGTSWLETLAMDIPTVCFYDEHTYAFRGSAQPLIERLQGAGILYTSAAAAAAHVRTIAADAQAWWRGTDVQAARRAFVERYANFSSAWAQEWETELRRWIE